MRASTVRRSFSLVSPGLYKSTHENNNPTKNIDKYLKIIYLNQRINKSNHKIVIFKIMKYLTLLFFLISTWAQAQQRYKVTGTVTQVDTKLPIAGASISIVETGHGLSTDSLGRYEIVLNKGSYLFEVSHQSYFKKLLRIEVNKNIVQNYSLNEKVNNLEEVQISAKSAEENLKRLGTGVSSLSIKAVKKLPTLLGEADVIKGLFTLPGVTSVGEGSNGFNVRGGNVDQNLILLDEAPIFNSSHLMGFFSIFNPDALRDVEFYRGGVPAQYGGRTSSVLNINLKDANAQKLGIEGAIGNISSRLVIETPLVKDKASMFLAGRISYVDQMVKVFNVQKLTGSKANFYDLTSKLEWRPSIKDRVSLVAFTGYDVFKLGRDSLAGVDESASSAFNWRSTTATLSWNRFFSNKFSMKNSIAMSNYSANITNPDSATSFRLSYAIRYKTLKGLFNWNIGQRQKVDFGYQVNHYDIQAGELNPLTSASNKNYIKLKPESALETSLFINDDIELGSKLSLGLGLRYVIFRNTSEGYQYNYSPNEPLSVNTIVDSTLASNNKAANTYAGFEPRLALNFLVGKNSTIKLSYNRMQQFIQLLSGTTSVLATDRWKLSDKFIKPQLADQISLGLYKNFKENTIESSIEVFYKKLQNVVDFKDGESLLLNQYPETAILQGSGLVYGAEFYLKKNLGQFTGWLSYTYSLASYLINGPTAIEKINNGSPFPPIYNRPHMFNTVATYQVSKKVSFSGNVVYNSGRAITYPSSKFLIRQTTVPYYNSRNQGTIPNYFRLDLSMNLDMHPYRTEGHRGNLSLSFYNILARRNAYSVFFRDKQQTQQYGSAVKIYKLSVIGTLIPSLSYSMKF